MANLDCDQGAVLPKAHVLLALNLGRNPQVGGKILGNMNQVKKKKRQNQQNKNKLMDTETIGGYPKGSGLG